MIDGLIKRFGQKVTLLRDDNPERTVKGKRVADSYKKSYITASVQPATPDELLEEKVGAERDKHGIRLYTQTELRTVNTVTRRKADIVLYEGDYFEVLKVDKWTGNNRSLPHYKALAMKMNTVPSHG